jgi:hypothetical protein
MRSSAGSRIAHRYAEDAPRDQGREEARLQQPSAVVSTTDLRVHARIAEPSASRIASPCDGGGKVAAVASRAGRWRIHILYTIAVILLVAWLPGFLGIYTIGSFVHVLLVIAIVLFLGGLLRGRRVWDSDRRFPDEDRLGAW